MGKILIVDDDQAFVKFIENYMKEHYPDLELSACIDPVRGLAEISADLDLLLLDLEMPGLDGKKLLAFATEKGLSKNRIIILSGRDADYLHDRFPMGSCLAVLNKHEAKQWAVLEMVFKAIQQKYGSL